MKRILVSLLVSCFFGGFIFCLVSAMEWWGSVSYNMFESEQIAFISTIAPMLLVFVGLVYYIVGDEL